MVEARLVDAVTGKAGNWTSLGTVKHDSTYRGSITTAAGWNSLEARARGAGISATHNGDYYFTEVCRPAMFEETYSLPGSQQKTAGGHRDGF